MKSKEEMLAFLQEVIAKLQKKFEGPLHVEISEPYDDTGYWIIDIGLSKDDVTVNVQYKEGAPMGVSDIGNMNVGDAFNFAPEFQYDNEDEAVFKIEELLRKDMS